MVMNTNPGIRIRGLGFTLIELLVVMAIIAILVSIATPRYFNSVEKSKEVVLKQDLSTSITAIPASTPIRWTIW
jgi:prepilin-type N-terminal cleavage/methylation domain-containing protein